MDIDLAIRRRVEAKQKPLSSLDSVFAWICDLGWILQALFWGKVLKLKKYCPQEIPFNDESLHVFQATFGATFHRMFLIIRFWDFRLATAEELDGLLEWQRGNGVTSPYYINYTPPKHGQTSPTYRVFLRGERGNIPCLACAPK